ncbi:AraC family transcriptional regulator [Kiritimatiellaeota bacterium B1221]|nr:AraC family transcriptional regulator [Kiritimatiellaeota bacterium B1221]
MKTSSQKSDFISTFLTSESGNPKTGVHKPGLYLREAIRWWAAQCLAGNSGLYFPHPLPKEEAKEWKLFLQIRGQNVLRLHQTRFKIPPGSIALYPSNPNVNEQWQMDDQGRYSHFFMGIFSGRLSANFVDGNPPQMHTSISMPFTQKSFIDRMIHFISASSKAPPHQAQVFADILLDGMRISSQDTPSRLIRQALELILDHPCNPDLSVKWMAQQLACHPDYLSRRFHLETRSSFMAYVRSKRMEVAADLLSSHQMTVADVAAHCGYRDHSYFTRIFHQTYGVVPSQWMQNSPRN